MSSQFIFGMNNVRTHTAVQCLNKTLHLFFKIKIKNWPEKRLNYALALFKTNSYQTGLILKRLLKYDTLDHTLTYMYSFEVVHNGSIEFTDLRSIM